MSTQGACLCLRLTLFLHEGMHYICVRRQASSICIFEKATEIFITMLLFARQMTTTDPCRPRPCKQKQNTLKM